MDVVSEILSSNQVNRATADAESVELFEQQFVVKPVEGFNEVKIEPAHVMKDLK